MGIIGRYYLYSFATPWRPSPSLHLQHSFCCASFLPTALRLPELLLPREHKRAASCGGQLVPCRRAFWVLFWSSPARAGPLCWALGATSSCRALFPGSAAWACLGTWQPLPAQSRWQVESPQLRREPASALGSLLGAWRRHRRCGRSPRPASRGGPAQSGVAQGKGPGSKRPRASGL